MSTSSSLHESVLLLCDACCDRSGTLKEMVKSGGCTCDICGWSCKCCQDTGKSFVNRILTRHIPDDGWPELQERNRRSLTPVDWEAVFSQGRRRDTQDP